MVNIQSPTAEIRRGKKKIEEERRNRMKIYMVSLLHRATINENSARLSIKTSNIGAKTTVFHTATTRFEKNAVLHITEA